MVILLYNSFIKFNPLSYLTESSKYGNKLILESVPFAYPNIIRSAKELPVIDIIR